MGFASLGENLIYGRIKQQTNGEKHDAIDLFWMPEKLHWFHTRRGVRPWETIPFSQNVADAASIRVKP